MPVCDPWIRLFTIMGSPYSIIRDPYLHIGVAPGRNLFYQPLPPFSCLHHLLETCQGQGFCFRIPSTVTIACPRPQPLAT
ncbi:hypothetical protein GDO81_030038 [Engystomops pustulosus]|uniref:Uncharacterized protein n=1 Tax=Engystomops pustulosus TaxID=76066 RepID=A0AAV6YDL8_ENGPU|nr:hypothetical protein GDO81_030038 [Engystomops pustulosus]